MSGVSTPVPDAGTPIFDAKGFINPVWHQFFFTLLRRTGGTDGIDAGTEAGRIDLAERRITDVEQVEYAQVSDHIELLDDQPIMAIDHGLQYDPLLHAQVTALADGFMIAADKSKLDGIAAGATVASVSGTAPITSSGGATPAIGIVSATPSVAGSMSAFDKGKLDGIAAGAAVASVGATAPIASSGGNNPVISIAAATPSAAGSLSASDKTKLDGITAGAAVSTVTGTAPIASSGGTAPAISISAATPSAAGSLSASDKTRIDQLAASASPTFAAMTLTNGQLVFPATQVPSANANTLDDYHEGTYTPTVTASSGTLTAYTATGIYTKVGRLVTATISVTITTNGTGAGSIVVTLPFTASAIPFSAGGIETSTAKAIVGLISASSSTVNIFKYDATYPAGTGFTLILTISYFV